MNPVETIESKGPLGSFPWHLQQDFALASATNVVVVLGGNQSGKSTVGNGVVSRLVRREGPVYRRLRNPEGRRLKIWVSPQTLEKFKSNWEQRLLNEVFDGLEFRYVQSPHTVFTWEDEHGGGELWGKSQDQGFMSFESDVVDLIVFDEEPADPRLFTSATQRLATTNGIILFTFTPLRGMSWTHGTFLVPSKKLEYQVADRVWRRGNDITLIQMGMADNPESVAGGGVARVQNSVSMTEAEKATRLYGEYGYAEGLIFPTYSRLHVDIDDCPYIIDELPKGRPYSWILTADPNKRHGGLLTAIDHEGNRFYVSEHYAEDIPDRLHAKAYMAILKRAGLVDKMGQVVPTVGIYSDPGGAGSQAIINMSDCGIFAQPVKKDQGSVKASIELMRRAAWIDPMHRHPVTGVLGAPHAFFLRTLRSTWTLAGVDYTESRLMWELRQYRQKEGGAPDVPVKEKDDVTDCARYLELVRPYAPTPEDTTIRDQRARLDRGSRREHEEFDELAAKAMKPRRQEAEVW